jgi:hypothetical protein
MCNLFTKFMTASKALVVPELSFSHSERGMWLAHVKNLKQIPDTTTLP